MLFMHTRFTDVLGSSSGSVIMRLRSPSKVVSNGTVVRLDDIVQNHPMSNTEYIVQDLHDILESYYKVARKRFVATICMQGTDQYLVTGPDSTLKLFLPAFVINMSTEQLEEIAGEDIALKRKRKQLQKEIMNLEAGRKILY